MTLKDYFILGAIGVCMIAFFLEVKPSTGQTKWYWYVSYTYQKTESMAGFGSSTLSTDQNWFPIYKVEKFIQGNKLDLGTILITNWQSISEEQFNEYAAGRIKK